MAPPSLITSPHKTFSGILDNWHNEQPQKNPQKLRQKNLVFFHRESVIKKNILQNKPSESMVEPTHLKRFFGRQIGSFPQF